VLDRAYCSYKFINFLNNRKINFVCRFRNNCKKFNELDTSNRIIKLSNQTKDSILLNGDYFINDAKINKVNYQINEEYTLITNLNKDNYNDDKVKDIYHKRWDVEVFFKILKSNFKFENQKITNVDQKNNIYNIHNIKLLIVFLFSKIIEKICKSQYEIKKNNTITKTKRIYKNKRIKKITEPIPKKRNTKKKTKKSLKKKIMKMLLK